MASNYTGNPTATQAPAVAPTPGVAPVASIPSGTDAPTIESITQAFKVAMDYLAYVFLNILATIFVSKPTTASDVAQVYLKDASGNVRSVFDHNGYPSGRRSEYRENWDFNLVTNAIFTNQTIFGGSGYSRWNGKTISGTRNIISTQPGGASDPSSYLQIFNSTGSTSDICSIYGQYPWVKLQTYTSLVMEFETNISTPSGTTFALGLVDIANAGSTAPAAGASGAFRCQLGKRTGDTNWQAITGDGTTVAFTDLGVVATAGVWTRIRIELHGSGSPYGACARFFINDVQVGGNITTHVPSAPTITTGSVPEFGVWATAGSNNAVASVSGLYVTYNRTGLSLPAV